MKTIHIITGATKDKRIRYINQKGESPYSFDSSVPNPRIRLLTLSIEDALSKKNNIFIEIPKVTPELVELFNNFQSEKNIDIVSYFLASQSDTENFAESERDFGLFLQILHSKIYFDYFPKI